MITGYALLLLFFKIDSEYKLPQGLMSAVCYVESKHKTRTVNKKDGLLRDGARGVDHSIGICQIKLRTARQFEPKITYSQLLNPENNIRMAAKYLKWQLERYEYDIPCGIAAYNAGSCRFNDSGKIKNRNYVNKVFKSWTDNK